MKITRRFSRGIRLKVFKNRAELNDAVAKHILARSRARTFLQGYFSLVFSGGVTPKGIYERMAKPPYRDQFEWQKIHFFWGDERWVLPGSARSNFRLASESLLKKAAIPRENIHTIKTKNVDIKEAAELYEREIVAYFGLEKGGFPSFDLVLLGVGEDGNIASLFPGHSALKERRRWVLPVESSNIRDKRLTITFPVLNHADEIVLIVTGRKKAKIVKTIMEAKRKTAKLPVRRLRLRKSNVLLYADKAAASGIDYD